MDWHSTLLFVHILLFVFWLGTDVGVFLGCKITERSDLSVETRATVLKLSMVLDRMPRTALALIIPTGLQLAVNLGQLHPADFVLPVVWAVSLIWTAILWAGFLNPETPTEKKALLINFAMNALMAVLVCGFAIYLFVSGDTAIWLTVKILMVGLIFVTGVVLDALFKPAIEAFVAILTQGASPERDSAYSKAIGPVYKAVLTIYVLVLVAAWFGVTKPTF